MTVGKRRSPKKRRSRKMKKSDGGGDDEEAVVRFFENLLRKDKPITVTSSTKEVFKSFFDAFQRTSVEVSEYDIQERNYQVGVFSHINKDIKRHIDLTMKRTYVYSFYTNRPVNIEISFPKDEQKRTVVQYLHMMKFWLNVVTPFATEPCSETLNITIFLSDLKKVLISSKCSTKSCVIENTRINTGYSTRCDEIVIFREEEWFKVFVHETFHNLGLDFFTSYQSTQNKLRSFFNLPKFDMKLYEAYTESWARIMNVLLLSFDVEKKDFNNFVNLVNKNIMLERLNAYFQSIKMLKYQGYDIDDLTTYKETTGNFSYYVLVAILYTDYQDFILWCKNNNDNIIQFSTSQSQEKQHLFVDFIISKTASFKKNLESFKKFFEGEHTDYLHTYMKKSILSRSLTV